MHPSKSSCTGEGFYGVVHCFARLIYDRGARRAGSNAREAVRAWRPSSISWVPLEELVALQHLITRNHTAFSQ